ncbi:MAG: hypothetical protein JSR77_15120 [Planctomycetes bacterium]|nr:hypothetical protein [Planctomycetota bacterium]
MANRSSSTGPTMSLEDYSLAELADEARRREQRLKSLVKRRDRWQAKIAAIDAGLAEYGGGGSTRGWRKAPRRAKNQITLTEALRRAIGTKQMRVGAAAEAVLAAGYKSTSKDFGVAVSGILSRDRSFKRVAYGVYRVR